MVPEALGPITEYVITPHAAFEMRRRGLSEQVIRDVLLAAEQRLDARPGRIILQSKVRFGRPARDFLVRVFVDVDRRPAEVVTVYRTTRIAKYWRGSHEG